MKCINDEFTKEFEDKCRALDARSVPYRVLRYVQCRNCHSIRNSDYDNTDMVYCPECGTTHSNWIILGYTIEVMPEPMTSEQKQRISDLVRDLYFLCDDISGYDRALREAKVLDPSEMTQSQSEAVILTLIRALQEERASRERMHLATMGFEGE